ncbi:hypothetical protein D1614_22820 [Maribellus luteus]|uniref:Uncharacterized protein n=1 Tax=Maribellus luteus TaxID=2305463 RepID=A0A399SRF5_9BACT|nr:RES domain-containing protein [Maribellus luteus]RIJ45504.1 hypothetical protein D1614_22820 [Maribellus luteus]
MPLNEILKDYRTNLPIERKRNSNFRETLYQRLKNYEALIDFTDNIPPDVEWGEGKMPFGKRIYELIEGIIKTVDAYYEGNPHKAYTILNRTLNLCEMTKILNKDLSLAENSNLFRIRTVNSNYPLSKKEIFHIPFNMRERVATQRYSIPGLPCLYLANSIYVSWEELGRPSDNIIQASRFCNTRELRLLDLTNDIYSNKYDAGNNPIENWQLFYYLTIWPLVAACSVKVPDRNATFKPEYIIPQLLLQWINKNELDGIKYSSTHIDLNNTNHVGHMYNIVVPVKSFDKDEGYCDELVEMFKVSSVIPMQLTQIAMNRIVEGDLRNEDLRGIELIEGNRILYSVSSFGKLEAQLMKLEPTKIQ